MRLSTGQSFGSKLCEKLNLDPKLVRDISINIPIDGMVTVSVELYATDGQLDYLLTDYNFKPINSTEKEEIQNDCKN